MVICNCSSNFLVVDTHSELLLDETMSGPIPLRCPLSVTLPRVLKPAGTVASSALRIVEQVALS